MEWATVHWLDILQSIGILAGLLFTAHNVRADSRQRKIQSLFALTASHRDIWSKVYEHPHLMRVLRQAEGEVEPASVTEDEEMFVKFLILHLAASHRARKLGLYFQEEGLRMDVREFFSLPIPKQIWEKSRIYQDRDFVAFVESCL